MSERSFRFAMANVGDLENKFFSLVGSLYSIQTHLRIAKAAGYDGIEYFAFQYPSFQIRTFRNLNTRNVLSTHQTWGSGKFPEKLALREKVESLRDIQILQEKHQNILAVVFPNEKDEPRPQTFDIIKNKVIQPTPNLMDEWQTNSLTRFLEISTENGFRICLDLFHIRRGLNLGPWKDVIDAFIDHTDELHLGLGRKDFKGNFDSMAELEDIYNLTSKTEIIPILRYIRSKEKKLGRLIPIVVELPADGITYLLSQKDKIAEPRKLARVHSRIVKNLKIILK